MSPREKVVRGERDTKRKELEEETGGKLLRQLELETAEQGRSVKVYSILIALAGSTFLPEGKT